jgi:hypothetical protein
MTRWDVSTWTGDTARQFETGDPHCVHLCISCIVISVNVASMQGLHYTLTCLPPIVELFSLFPYIDRYLTLQPGCCKKPRHLHKVYKFIRSDRLVLLTPTDKVILNILCVHERLCSVLGMMITITLEASSVTCTFSLIALHAAMYER